MSILSLGLLTFGTVLTGNRPLEATSPAPSASQSLLTAGISSIVLHPLAQAGLAESQVLGDLGKWIALREQIKSTTP